jgi:hypothetical protein
MLKTSLHKDSQFKFDAIVSMDAYSQIWDCFYATAEVLWSC